MELQAADLEAYVRLVAPDAPEEKRARHVVWLKEGIEQGKRRLADFRVARDGAGNLIAALTIVGTGGSGFMLAGPFGAGSSADAAAADLVAEAMLRARAARARAICARPRADRAGPLYRAALKAHGFAELGERIEFKAPVAELPMDDGTPLRWRDLADIGEDRAAEMLRAVASGDPHGREESGDPRAALKGWLGAPALKSEPECVQIGFLEDRAVAFVCAQVSPKDGWSRITYLGLVPEVRGRGLGTWVHRRGFRMLKEQGGTLYHGGTAATNAPMVKLMRKHGCDEVARLLEFEWRADRA